MTVKQAAAHLHVSTSTVYHWIHQGKLLAYQQGGPRCGLSIPDHAVGHLLQRTAKVDSHALRPKPLPSRVG